MNRPILAIIVAIAACGIAVALYSTATHGPVSDGPFFEAGGASDEDAGEAGPGTEDASGELIAADRDPADAHPDLLDGIGEAVTSDDDGRAGSATGPRVRVLRGENRVPVPHATVAFLTKERFDEVMKEAKGGDSRLGVLIEQHGTRVSADDQGLAPLILPPPSQPARSLNRSSAWVGIAAWTDDEFAVQWLSTQKLSPDKSTIVDLVLEKDLTLEVVTVGADQQPVPNCPLVFYDLRGKRNAVRRDAFVADNAGRLLLRHFQITKPSAGRWALLPQVLCKAPTHIVIDLARFEPSYTLRVPAFGSLVFDLKGRDGRAILDKGTIQLRTEALAALQIEDQRLEPMNQVSQSTEQGRVRFDHVGLGMRFKAEVAVGRNFRERCSVDYAGPLRHGEELRYELRLENDGVSIRGVAVLPDGVAGSKGEKDLPWLELAFGADNNVRSSETAKVGEGQRFSFFVPFVQCSSYRLYLRMRHPEGDLRAYRQVVVSGPGSSIDLGDVALLPPEPILQGRVVDEDSKPIEKAQIVLMERLHGSNGRERVVKIGVDGAGTDKNGAFAILGPQMPGSYQITVTRQGYETKKLPVTLGKQPIEVRLALLGELTATLHLDPGIVSKLRFRARSQGGSSTSNRMSLPKSGTVVFRMANLLPGTYRLSAEIDEWGAPIWSHDAFVVRRGSQTLGQDIDLRGRLHRFKLYGSVDGRAFQKTDRATLLMYQEQVPDPKAAWRSTTFGGVVAFVAPQQGIRYRVHLPGAKPLEGTALPGTTELRFKAEAQHRFRVPGISARLELLRREVPAISAATAHLVFERVLVAGDTKHVDFSQMSAAVLHLEAGLMRRSVSMIDDRAQIAFEEAEAEYEVTLEVAAGRGLHRNLLNTLTEFDGNNSVRINSSSFGRRDTLRVSLGRYRPASQQVEVETVYALPDALEAQIRDLIAKVASESAASPMPGRLPVLRR